MLAVISPVRSLLLAIFMLMAGSGFMATLISLRLEQAGLSTIVIGAVALSVLFKETFASERVERDRLIVVLVMMFFSMLFWAFFEQAGSSINNFTDRNVDRVFEERVITQADVGQTVSIPLNQGQAPEGSCSSSSLRRAFSRS